jgi:putative transcription factor
MQCEICGNNAGKGTRIELDGVEMLACEACSKYGKVLDAPKPQTQQAFGQQFGAPKKIVFEKEEKFEQILLVDDFGARIKKAREQKQLTFEDFSHLVKEKASVLRNIESGHFEPSPELARRLEKTLNIRIIENS